MDVGQHRPDSGTAGTLGGQPRKDDNTCQPDEAPEEHRREDSDVEHEYRDGTENVRAFYRLLDVVAADFSTMKDGGERGRDEDEVDKEREYRIGKDKDILERRAHEQKKSDEGVDNTQGLFHKLADAADSLGLHNSHGKRREEDDEQQHRAENGAEQQREDRENPRGHNSGWCEVEEHDVDSTHKFYQLLEDGATTLQETDEEEGGAESGGRRGNAETARQPFLGLSNDRVVGIRGQGQARARDNEIEGAEEEGVGTDSTIPSYGLLDRAELALYREEGESGVGENDFGRWQTDMGTGAERCQTIVCGHHTENGLHGQEQTEAEENAGGEVVKMVSEDNTRGLYGLLDNESLFAQRGQGGEENTGWGQDSEEEGEQRRHAFYQLLLDSTTVPQDQKSNEDERGTAESGTTRMKRRMRRKSKGRQKSTLSPASMQEKA